MPLPLSYSVRNLWTRRLTTVLTAAGMALVVFVFAAILMLAQGLQKTLVATGSFDNVVVIRKGAGAEVQSAITRDQAAIVETDPEIAAGADGRPQVAKELLVLINIAKRSTGKRSNVAVRGIGPDSLSLRPQVRLDRRADASARLSGGHGGQEHLCRFSGRRSRRKHSGSACTNGPSSASSMRATRPSAPRCGETQNSSCRPFAVPHIRRSSSGSAILRPSTPCVKGSRRTPPDPRSPA